MVTEDQAHRWAWRYGGQKAAARALGVPQSTVRYWLNPEKAWESNRRWNKANPEKYRENSRRWRRANPEKEREYASRRYANNPDFRLRKAQYETLRYARNRIAELENQAKELYS